MGWSSDLAGVEKFSQHWTAQSSLRPKAGHKHTHIHTSLKSRFETDGVHLSHIRRSWVGSPEVELTAVGEFIISLEQAGHHF